MGYRKLDIPKVPRPRRTIQALSTPFHAWVTYGESVEVAIPCFYQEAKPPIPAVHHDIHWHHHVGWPAPDHPDHICQMAYTPHECGHKGPCKTCRHYLDASTIFPIHLNSEYELNGLQQNSFEIFMSIDGEPVDANPSVGPIHALAWVDGAQDWVVRLLFRTQGGSNYFLPFTYDIDKPTDVDVIVFIAQQPPTETATLWKVLCRGIVTIMPSPVKYTVAPS